MKKLLMGRTAIIFIVAIVIIGAGSAIYASTNLFTHTGTVSITVTGNPQPPPPPAAPVVGQNFTISQSIDNGTNYNTGTVLTFTNNSGYDVTVNVIPGTAPAGTSYTGETSKVIPIGGSNTVTLSMSAGSNYNGTYSIPLTIEATY